MARYWRSLVLFGLLTLLAQVCFGQELSNRWVHPGEFYVFQIPEAIADLGLTPKQGEQVKAIKSKFDAAVQAKGLEMEAAGQLDDVWKVFDEMYKEYRLKLKAILTEAQWKRFGELAIQIPGASKLLHPEMQELLELTEDQKKAILALQPQLFVRVEGEGEAANKKARDKYEEGLKKIEAVLTPKQRERFKSMQGKPLKRST